MGMPHPRRKHLMALTVICAVCTGMVVLLHLTGFYPLTLAELALRDTLLRYGKKSPTRPELVYLAIDQASLTLDEVLPAEIVASPVLAKMKNGWPWSRDIYPMMIDRLVSSGARVVAFDLLFPTSREGDELFRQALDRYRNKVVIGSNFSDPERGRGGSSTYELPASTLIPQSTPSDDRVGYVNFRPDIDEVTRHASYRTTASSESDMQPAEGEEVIFSFSSRILQKAGLVEMIPTSMNPVLIRFAQPRSFSQFPIYQIFVKKFWEGPQFRNGDFFHGKIVVIGPAGNWSKDYFQTPFGLRPGSELHLDAINAAMNRDFLSEFTGPSDILLILLGGCAAWILSILIGQPFLRFLALVGTVLAFYSAALFLFNVRGWETALLGFLLALVTSGLVRLVWEQVFDRIERRRTRRTLERYVSRDVASELLDNPESYLNSLGGVRKPVTILFSDLRGFTTRTESAGDPHGLVAQLNEYFNEMVRIVFSRNGTLDKFIGDALMAHWGSITSEGEKIDAQKAVKAAFEMRAALSKLNENWKKRGIEPLAFGIGLNHGEAIVGNLGCEAKMEVSAIGDAVNTASRMEGVTKIYHLDLLIGESVEPLVRDVFILRSVDCILLMGKVKPVKLYTVLSERGVSPEPAWLAKHEEALRFYRAGDFVAAESNWHDVLAACPGDNLATLFIERCHNLRMNPPGDAWSGVFEVDSK